MSDLIDTIMFLVGTWRGEGKGQYPTIDPFAYGEEVRFTDIPRKPFLVYNQRTWHPEKNAPMHTEAGYFRPAEGGRVEIVLALPTGQVEIEEGTVEGQTIETRSTFVGKTATAKDVTKLQRTIVVEGDTLRYTVSMAAVGQPLTPHLEAELRRIG
jgi:hypothetical protein